MCPAFPVRTFFFSTKELAKSRSIVKKERPHWSKTVTGWQLQVLSNRQPLTSWGGKQFGASHWSLWINFSVINEVARSPSREHSGHPFSPSGQDKTQPRNWIHLNAYFRDAEITRLLSFLSYLKLPPEVWLWGLMEPLFLLPKEILILGSQNVQMSPNFIYLDREKKIPGYEFLLELWSNKADKEPCRPAYSEPIQHS